MFWNRKPKIQTNCDASILDLESLCVAARSTVNRLPALEALNLKLTKDLAALVDEYASLHGRHADAVRERDRLADVLSKAERTADAAQAFRNYADKRSAVATNERDAALAELAKVRAAYEDLAGGLAVMMDVSLSVVETFPDEPEAEAANLPTF